jgi:hypothetical protein
MELFLSHAWVVKLYFGKFMITSQLFVPVVNSEYMKIEPLMKDKGIHKPGQP